ncbi:MAG: hypothetical protein EZS26_001427 [Candidatus Ordinivivax streblomastigis]|uniref:Outer membrane protein beta-barrel domain-containing protein n=1 Tax=Candidatus Ordinivivax streblomastigis TaxID=2540710 RepID=A0A5M8P1N8_9BACT|nr:MAG: hypothetical protein EZS26_001427 [Candidatus Ordinivivax streblomastigis]
MERKICILFFCVLSASNLAAQKRMVQNQPYGDQQWFHFGISVGMNFQDLILTNAGVPDALSGQTWYATLPDYSPGFSVGLLTDMYMNPFMNLRITPMLHFGDKQFAFVEPNTGGHYKSVVRSNYLTVPLDVKFRALRLNNYRPYFLAGAYTAIDLGRKTDEAVYLQPMDFGLTLGIGCDFYLPIIKIIPELRFSFGLTDVVKHNRTDLTNNDLQKYSDAISKGLTRMISLTFNFE